MAMMRLARRRDRAVSVIRMATTMVMMMMVMVWLRRTAKEVILRSTSYGCHLLLATIIWTIVSCMPAVFVVQAPNTVFVSADEM